MPKFQIDETVRVMVNCHTHKGIVTNIIKDTKNRHWYTINKFPNDIFHEFELEKISSGVMAMQKFQIGDIVRIINNRGCSNIPVGAIGTILKFYENVKFPYVLAEFLSLGFRESDLELVTTSFTEVTINNNGVSSTDPDLDKRVSETRDELLKDIFGS